MINYKTVILPFDDRYKIDIDVKIVQTKDRCLNRQNYQHQHNIQIQKPIIDYIEHNVLETDKRFIAAQNTLNKFHKKYSIYENLEDIELFDGDMQTWFYHNHIYYNVLKEISKVYMHSKYIMLLNRFVYLNCYRIYRFETEQNAIKNCKRLQLAPTDIQIEVSLLCEILRAFDYSKLDKNDLAICQISNVFSLRGKTIGTKYVSNFLEYLPEFHFLNKPEIYKVVANSSFVRHSYFSKMIRKLR